MAPDGFNGGSWQQPRNTSESEENTERTDPQLTRWQQPRNTSESEENTERTDPQLTR
ncbi:hypothetical protein F2Q70_00016404 [Brassica cretica]|uniref:Uncharacterized protein n=1 Tax=Brassica cretica TaxID=69181 RepID=A0A8S9I508_BRACR|nr:hypothetical protein F2Q70_00016404 [Brassica cretica]